MNETDEMNTCSLPSSPPCLYSYEETIGKRELMYIVLVFKAGRVLCPLQY